jgi:hypothetical protein
MRYECTNFLTLALTDRATESRRVGVGREFARLDSTAELVPVEDEASY